MLIVKNIYCSRCQEQVLILVSALLPFWYLLPDPFCLCTQRKVHLQTKMALFFFFYTLNFSFCIGLQPINSIVVVSGEQRRDSATHIHVSTLQTPLPSRLTAHCIFNLMLPLIRQGGASLGLEAGDLCCRAFASWDSD